MKKIISVLLTLALVLSLVPAVFAADEPTFSLSADKETAGAGDTVTLTVNFSNNGTILEIGGLNFEIIYDEEAYTFVSATPAKAYRPYFASSSEGTSAGNGKLLVGGIITTTADYPIEMEDGELATYTFKANDVAAESASFKLDVKELNTFGTTPTPISNKTENGELTIPVTGGSVTPEGYSVSIPETKSVTTGETVEIPITISGKDYNAYSMRIRYYTDVLELQNEAVNNEGFRLSESKGTDTNKRPFSSITLIRYGEVAEPGVALTLKFTAKAQGTTDVTILNARVDERANSISFNAPDATITNGTTAVTVSGYTVSLPDDFTRTDTEGTVIMDGDTLKFIPKDPNYDYTVTVTVGGAEVTPTIGEDGTYTVASVNGNVTVTSTKTPKTFSVTLGDDTNGDATATYKTDYTFKLTPVKDYIYDVKVTIGGKEYTGLTSKKNDDGTTTYTILGADITGEIAINSNKGPRPMENFSVTFEGTGIGDVSNNANTVTENESYSFTLTKKEGFDYTVSATMGGTAVELTETTDAENANVVTYSIGKVTGDLVITVNKESTLTMEVAVSEYVQMDDKTVFLVTVTGTPAEGKAYAYGENVMYKTTAYGANVYSWLVIVDKGQEFTAAVAEANITEAAATAEEVAQSYDVNETGVVDINDAQLVYDIYSGKYGDFEKVSVRKFLRADVNITKTVDATDAVAVVANSK
jgi:hypothetical protein